MNWDEKAADQAEQMDRKDSDWYALTADLLFRDGARWQRDQLRTDEAIERVADVLHEKFPREAFGVGVLMRSERNTELTKAARAAITALLGED